MILQTMDIKYILQHILPSPEMLEITCAYIESETVRYKQYGSYDAVAVQREGVRLLELLDEVEQTQDARLWCKWQSRYQAWQKKLIQIKLSIPHFLWCGRPSHAFCGHFCSNIFCGAL